VGEDLEKSDAYDFCGLKQLSAQLSAVPYLESSPARVAAAARDAPRDQAPQQHALISNSPMWVARAAQLRSWLLATTDGLKARRCPPARPLPCRRAGAAPADVLLLQRAFGVRSCLVLPIVLGREVLGALLVAAPVDQAFAERWALLGRAGPSIIQLPLAASAAAEQLDGRACGCGSVGGSSSCCPGPCMHHPACRDVADLRALVAMVAPHAAILRRSIKSSVARTVLNTMLPMRVLELIDHRLGRQTVHDY
jgi:hypothetical protein